MQVRTDDQIPHELFASMIEDTAPLALLNVDSNMLEPSPNTFGCFERFGSLVPAIFQRCVLKMLNVIRASGLNGGNCNVMIACRLDFGSQQVIMSRRMSLLAQGIRVHVKSGVVLE